jgi:DNA-binding MarR family transcriptional regulator
MSEHNDSCISSELEIIVKALETFEDRIAIIKRQALRHYKSRRTRDELFGKPDLFGEPAWDMLVDLFIAGEEGKKISVSSLCVASAVPMTTALRWIAILESRALIERTADALDARRSYLSLAIEAQAKIRTHFELRAG